MEINGADPEHITFEGGVTVITGFGFGFTIRLAVVVNDKQAKLSNTILNSYPSISSVTGN